MDPRYDILFAGQLLAGHELAAVRARLGQLFKADDATLDKLFSGKPQVLKRNCDKGTALQYKKALEGAGAQVVVRHSDTPDAAAANPATGAAGRPDAGSPDAGSPDAGALVLEPAGRDVLRPDERAGPIAATVSAPALELAEVGARLAEATATAGAPPDTSHLSLDPPGAYQAMRSENQAPVFTGDDIELAAAGTDFSDCAPPPASPPTLDLSGLALAPAGADVLEQGYRARTTSPAPDTSHITLAD